MSFQDTRLWNVEMILKDHGPDVILSKKYIGLEFEDTFPQTAKITLSAKGGKFTTTGTIIEKWDRIFIKITDQNGDIISTVVHVQSLSIQRGEGGGLILVLYCPRGSSRQVPGDVCRPLS